MENKYLNKTEIYKYYGWNPADGDYIPENKSIYKENGFYQNIFLYVRVILNKIYNIFL